MVKLSSVTLGFKQKLFLMLVASLMTSLFVFVFLFIWDGSDWGFIEGGLWLNLLFLYGLGLIFSYLFLGREFKKTADKRLKIAKGKAEITDKIGKRSYDNHQVINIRIDRHFYVFIKHERLTITFKTFGVRSKTHETFLLKQGDHDNLKEKIIEALKSSPAQNQDTTP